MNIPIIYALNNEYTLTTYVAVRSMLKFALPETRYLVYFLIPDSFEEMHIKKYEDLALEFPSFQFTMINMGDLFDGVHLALKHTSQQTYYRLVAAELLKDIDRCIYLDGDLLVLEDLTELFCSLDDEYYLAGVKDAGCHLWSEQRQIDTCRKIGLESLSRYINAGMLVMNLKKIRQEGVTQKLLEVIKNDLPYQDQDAINIVCYKKIQHLPFKYNVMVYYVNQDITEDLFGVKEVEEARISPAIVHFASENMKPWKNRRIIYAKEWWQIAEQSGYDLTLLKQEENKAEIERKYSYLLQRFSREKDIVIFGYSEISIKLVRQLESRGVKNIKCYCDNDMGKRGYARDGKEVVGLSEILTRFESPFFIVASQRYYRDIYRQLVNCEVADEKIYQYRNLGYEYYLCLTEDGKKEDYIV